MAKGGSAAGHLKSGKLLCMSICKEKWLNAAVCSYSLHARTSTMSAYILHSQRESCLERGIMNEQAFAASSPNSKQVSKQNKTYGRDCLIASRQTVLAQSFCLLKKESSHSVTQYLSFQWLATHWSTSGSLVGFSSLKTNVKYLRRPMCHLPKCRFWSKLQ